MIWTRQPAGLGAVSTEFKAKSRWEGRWSPDMQGDDEWGGASLRLWSWWDLLCYARLPMTPETMAACTKSPELPHQAKKSPACRAELTAQEPRGPAPSIPTAWFWFPQMQHTQWTAFRWPQDMPAITVSEAVVMRVGGAFPQLYLNGLPEEVEDGSGAWKVSGMTRPCSPCLSRTAPLRGPSWKT